MPVKYVFLGRHGWFEVYCDFDMVTYCRRMRNGKILHGWRAEVIRQYVLKFGFAN